jgi:hypothetical protein
LKLDDVEASNFNGACGALGTATGTSLTPPVAVNGAPPCTVAAFSGSGDSNDSEIGGGATAADAAADNADPVIEPVMASAAAATTAMTARDRFIRPKIPRRGAM